MKFLAVAILLLISACSSTWQFSTFEQIRLTHLAEQICPETEGNNPLCDVPMALNTGNFANAFATPVNIQVTRPLLRMMSDDEIAFTLTHELGHKFLHINTKRVVPKNMKELEADRFAQYVIYCRSFNHLAGITSLEKLIGFVLEENKPFMRQRIKLMRLFDPSEVDCNE